MFGSHTQPIPAWKQPNGTCISARHPSGIADADHDHVSGSLLAGPCGAAVPQVTGSVGSLVEKHSEAVAVEKRQREAVRKQAEQALRQVAVRSAEEHKLQARTGLGRGLARRLAMPGPERGLDGRGARGGRGASCGDGKRLRGSV